MVNKNNELLKATLFVSTAVVCLVEIPFQEVVAYLETPNVNTSQQVIPNAHC